MVTIYSDAYLDETQKQRSTLAMCAGEKISHLLSFTVSSATLTSVMFAMEQKLLAGYLFRHSEPQGPTCFHT